MADVEIIDDEIEIIIEETEIVIEIGEAIVMPEWGMIRGTLANQQDLQTALDEKANSADLGALAAKDKADWNSDLSNIPASFPPAAHDHDDRYYTETETNNLLSGKQDTLTFDDDPTEDSTNPVKSGGVYDALAAKQDNLTFDDAPTQSSDNPVKSGGVYTALADKLGLHATADLAGGVTPIKLTNQDLNDYRQNNTTWFYGDGTNTVSNKPTGMSSFGMVAFRSANGYYIQIIFSASATAIYSRAYNSSSWTTWSRWNLDQLPIATSSVLGGVKVGQNLSISDGVLNADASGIVNTASGDPVNIADGADAPALGLSAEIAALQDLHGYDHPWAPGCGKNLWNPNDWLQAYPASATGIITSGQTNARTIYMAVTAGETYTISKIVSTRFYITFCENLPEIGTQTENLLVLDPTETEYTFTVPEGMGYVCFYVSQASDSASFREEVLASIMIEAGSSASPYEPYGNVCPISGYDGCSLTVNGTPVSVSWQSAAGTVYGGTIDVLTGLLTVTHGQISSYAGETLPGAWISDRDMYASGTVPTAGAQVVYELAEPVTVQLDPTEISTILGSNTISADTGPVTLRYRADTKLYIDGKFAELQALILEV